MGTPHTCGGGRRSVQLCDALRRSATVKTWHDSVGPSLQAHRATLVTFVQLSAWGASGPLASPEIHVPEGQDVFIQVAQPASSCMSADLRHSPSFASTLPCTGQWRQHNYPIFDVLFKCSHRTSSKHRIRDTLFLCLPSSFLVSDASPVLRPSVPGINEHFYDKAWD